MITRLLAPLVLSGFYSPTYTNKMIAVTADIHAANHKPFATVLANGRNSRLQAILDSVRWIAQDARERGCKYFCNAGDLFHSRKTIEVSVLSAVSELIDELSESFRKVILVVGNHDLSLTSGGGNSPSAFKRKNVLVVDRPTIVKCGQLIVGCIPWIPQRLAFVKAIKRVSGRCHGIVTHAALDRSWAGPSDWEVEGDIDLSDVVGKHRWVLMGHFHKSQSWRIKNVFVAYTGSSIQHSFGERKEPKGYWIATRSKEPVFIENPNLPQFVQVEHKRDLKKVRDFDYVRTVGQRANSLKQALNNCPNVIALPPVANTVAQRLPLQSAGDHKIISSYLKIADMVPEGLDRRDLQTLGLTILRS